MLLAFGWTHVSMLGWLAALAAPIVIHLWSKRKHREISWAAMEYLLAAAKQQTRRLFFEQWLLLAIRTLLIAMVVLAVAQPYIQRPRFAISAGGHSHRVLVLDGSFSMGYRANEKTRFDQAKEISRQIVNDSLPGDVFTLVLMSAPPQVIVATPTSERSEIEHEIDILRLPQMPAHLPATIEAVRQLAETAQHDNPRLVETDVYFLTDLQRATWAPALSASASAEFSRQAEALSQMATVSVIDVGQPITENLAVTSLRAVDPLMIVGHSVRFEAQLKNFGRQARDSQAVELFVDGRRIEQKEIMIAADTTSSVSFTYRFDRPGDHAIEVRAEGDALEIDNHRFFAARVRQAIHVLCIDGRPSGVPFHGAADYLAAALSPQDQAATRSLMQPEIASENAITDRDLRAYDCVVLCNVAQFTAAEVRVLDAYLHGGGNLMFFLGDQVLADRYNQELGGVGQGRAAAPRILPAQLGAIRDGRQSRLDPLGFQHPIVQPFRGRGEAALVTTPILKYYKLTLAKNSTASTVLAMANGDPLIVEASIHRGRVVIVATAAEPRTSWTAMPLLPSFVPLVQEIVAWCVGGNWQRANVLTGEPLDLLTAGSVTDGPLFMQTPDGRSQPVPLHATAGTEALRYGDTTQSGIYVARLGVSHSKDFAVNVDTAESDLTPISPEELRKDVWPGISLNDQTSQDIGAAHAAMPIHSTGYVHISLLYAALGLLFAETLLAWKMGR